MRRALITGASAGLGEQLARALAADGWNLILTARGVTALRAVADELGATAVVGDVADPAHRRALVAAVAETDGGLDLLVNNAGELGPSPLPPLSDLRDDDLARILDVNVVAPAALTRDLLPALLADRGVVLDISSDAAAEAYPGWGGYGASKAALEQLSAVLAVEQPSLSVYAVDPGDLRTDTHQRAFPGEDISDRPLPVTVVPGFLRLLRERPPSGRYRAATLLEEVPA